MFSAQIKNTFSGLLCIFDVDSLLCDHLEG